MAADCARSAQAELPGVAAGLPQRPCCQVSAQLRSLNLALIKHCSKVLLNAFFVSSGGLSHLCAHPLMCSSLIMTGLLLFSALEV